MGKVITTKTNTDYYKLRKEKWGNIIIELKTPQQEKTIGPFNLKILKTDIDKYIRTDDELVKLKSKVEYIQTVIDFLDKHNQTNIKPIFKLRTPLTGGKFTSNAI